MARMPTTPDRPQLQRDSDRESRRSDIDWLETDVRKVQGAPPHCKKLSRNDSVQPQMNADGRR